MMIHPFGHEPAGLSDRSFGVVDAVERRAGLEGAHVRDADIAQFAIGGDHGALTAAGDMAEVASHEGLQLRITRNGWKDSDI